MSTQAKISTFFAKKPTSKRSAEEKPLSPVNKAPKLEKDENENDKYQNESDHAEQKSPCGKSRGEDTVHNTSLSPEQMSRMQAKKAEAERKREKLKDAPANMGSSWKLALCGEFNKDYFKKLQDFVRRERERTTIYPPEKDVYTWTQMSEIKSVKVVIIGQDPYHGPKQAHGLCFSVQPGVAIPPSLQNMYKELVNDIPGFKHPGHGYLIGWAKQGVLLLNACLTVVAHQANAHQGKGWESFTDAVIRWLNSNVPNIVFMLWGSYAQKKCNFIDKKKHCVLKAPHPSPLSAHRGFFGSKHFSQANEYLKKNGRKVIDWSFLPIEIKD